MKIVGTIARIGQIALVILWMAACSGGGQSGGDLAMNGPTAEKGGNPVSSDQTKEIRNDDRVGNSEEHQESDSGEHDDDEAFSSGSDTTDEHGADHSSDQANNESDQSVGAASGQHGQDGEDAHDSGFGGSGSGHDAENSGGDGGHGDDNDADDSTGTGGTGNTQEQETDSDVTPDPNDRSDDNESLGDNEEFPIVTAEDQQQRVRAIYQPQAAQFLAIWNDFREDNGWEVYGRVINARGGSHGPLRQISLSDVEHRTPPGIAHDPEAGRSLVVWGTADGDVLGRVVDQSGSPSGPVITIASSATGEAEPTVAFEATTARYVVAWIETNPGFTLYSRMIDREGRLVGDAAPFSEAASGKLDLRLAADHDTGRFLAVWRDYRGEDIYSIFGRMIGPDGLPTSEEIVIADAVGSQINPELAYDATARSFLVTWSDSRRSGAYELFGQVVASPDGLLVGSNVPLSSEGGYPHAIGVDRGGSRYLVVYSKGSGRLYARYLAPDGVAEGGEFSLSTNEARQNSPNTATASSDDGILATWTDEREGAPHIFGRLLTTDEPSASPPGCSGLSTPDGLCLDCEDDAGALVDAACPVDGSYDNHGDYLACVTDVVNSLRHDGHIGGACKVNLIAPRARSIVGR